MNEFQRWLMVAVEPTTMASLRATPPQSQGLTPSNAGPSTRQHSTGSNNGLLPASGVWIPTSSTPVRRFTFVSPLCLVA